MRGIFALCAAVLIVVVMQLLAYRSAPDHFGAPFTGRPVVAIGALVDRPQDHVRRDVRVEGRVVKQCPSTGCWFFLADASGKEVKVEMGDAAPRVPPRLGWNAAVEGLFIPFGKDYELVGTAAEFQRGDRP